MYRGKERSKKLNFTNSKLIKIFTQPYIKHSNLIKQIMEPN